MKKWLLAIGMGVLAQFSVAQQASFIYSTDKGSNCIVRVNAGKISDNKLDVEVAVTWVSADMKPMKDLKSVVCLDFSKVQIQQKDFVKILNEQKVLVFNDKGKIRLDIFEEFQGKSIDLQLPFKYAVSNEIALGGAGIEEFTFKRPRESRVSIPVEPNMLIDKTAPKFVFLEPEGVEEGLKPLINESFLRVRIQATDFFGISKVVVNTLQAELVEENVYEIEVPLRAGFENTIKTVVTDVSGFATNKDFAVVVSKSEPKPAAVLATTVVVAPPKPAMVADVDTAIPVSGYGNELRFALIIGNEDYSSHQSGLESEMNVDFAERDAEVFKEYAIKILGIPEANIVFLKNARALDMHKGINKMNSLIKSTRGEGEFFVYYAGHGFPDEKSKEPYLVPVDVSGSDLTFAIKLNDLYKKMSEFPSKRVTVFLDACFSGGGREMGLMAARGVKIKPREDLVQGNIVVFSASSGEQSSLPYRDKYHGMFTYYLLLKLKETQGRISYSELSEYLSSQVSIKSVIINEKEQNPQTNISGDLVGKWKNWKFIE